MTRAASDLHQPKVRPRPEGGGEFAPALGGGSGANRAASGPGELIVEEVASLSSHRSVEQEVPAQGWDGETRSAGSGKLSGGEFEGRTGGAPWSTGARAEGEVPAQGRDVVARSGSWSSRRTMVQTDGGAT